MSSEKRKNKEKRNNIKVFVRCRPLFEFQNEPAWQISDSNTIECMHTKSVKQKIDKSSRRSEIDVQAKFKEMVFQYEKVYKESITSQKIYKQEVRQAVSSSLNSTKNLTLMCYGQTCSGKTFTILGQESLPGIMPCLLRDLILFKNQSQNDIDIKISYFEIYNQLIYDLLAPSDKKAIFQESRLKLVQKKNNNWQVSGLKTQNVESFEQCLKIIEKGQKNRSYASKQNHERSSRSHTIMRIYIQKYDQKHNKVHQIFNIVDLAGSQRLSEYSKNPQQTASINKSLFQLSNVISKLSTNDRNSHIPYRDSKLTKLLECSLNGNSSCIVVFCISPAVDSFYQTLSTLRLAKKAKHIQVEANDDHLVSYLSPIEKQLFETKQKLSEKTSQCQQLQARLQFLNQQLERLRQQVQQIESKSYADTQLLILLDHENFVIRDLGSNEFMTVQNWKSEELHHQIIENQQQFKYTLQRLYQQYASDIAQLYLKHIDSKNKGSSQEGAHHLIKIEEVCFANLIFDEKLSNFCKNESLDKLIHELELQTTLQKQNNRSNQEVQRKKYVENNTSNLVEIVKEYKRILSSRSQKSFSTKYEASSKKLDRSLFSTKSKELNQRKTIQADYKIEEIESRIEQFQYRKIYSWGCSKDSRTLKSNQVLPGIQVFQNESLGSIKDIKTSYNHNILLTGDGKLYGWGKNNFHQVSHKEKSAISIPMEISLKEKIKSIATGWGHSLALAQAGTVYTWGNGENGQLGHGNLQNVKKPSILKASIQCSQIFAGHSHSAIIDTQGCLYTFGFNKDNRCMTQTEQPFITLPSKVYLNNIKSASLGISHSAVLTTQNYVFCGGAGSHGEFGQELTLQIPGCKFFQVENKKFEQPDRQYERICPLIELPLDFLEDNQHVQMVKCAQNSTYFLTNHGNLYFCGKPFTKTSEQQFYSPVLLLQNIESFSIGSRHGFAFEKNSQKVFGWGFNMYNQLGNSKQTDLLTPEAIVGVTSLGIRKIQCGFIHTIALTK